MKLIPVAVRTYSGYKADEYPQSLVLGDDEIIVDEIVDRWYQNEDSPDFPEADYFRVKSHDGRQYLVKHVIEDDQWFFCVT
jgi:hypothetical protein